MSIIGEKTQALTLTREGLTPVPTCRSPGTRIEDICNIWEYCKKFIKKCNTIIRFCPVLYTIKYSHQTRNMVEDISRMWEYCKKFIRKCNTIIRDCLELYTINYSHQTRNNDNKHKKGSAWSRGAGNLKAKDYST